MRTTKLLLVLLIPLAGCPAQPQKSSDAGSKDLSNRTLDFQLAAGDLTVLDDMPVATDDGGVDDLAVPPGADLAGAKDLLTGKTDGGGCIQLASWPTAGVAAGYDSTGPVTFALESDKAARPYNLFSIEDWETTGETWPKVVTYDSTVTYNANNACEVCALITACTTTTCTKKWFAQAGTLTVTQADRNVATGRLTATGSNLKLVEWDFNTDLPVTNGTCYQIAVASFDIPWSMPTDGGVADAGPQDLGSTPNDSATGPADLAGDLQMSADGGVVGCHPVVNELQTAGSTSAADEWVEIFNPCSSSINLTGWKLVYRSAGNNKGGADITSYTFNQTLAGGAYLLIVGSSYKGAPASDGLLATGLAGAGGAVGLRDPSAKLIDSVSYNVLTTANKLTEKAPAPNPPTSKSIARLPNGTDTNDNSLDFKVAATPTPKAAN